MTVDFVDETSDLTTLVEIPKKDALAFFVTDGAIDPILARVKREIDKFVPDAATPSGRKAIASMAHKVARSKTALEAVGKELADEQKAIPKKIDATRAKIKAQLDQWRDEVRKPLTDWEAAENARQARHLGIIAEMKARADRASAPDATSAVVRRNLDAVIAIEIGPHCDEYQDLYAATKQAAIAALTDAFARLEKREREQQELEALRAQAAERAAAERIEQIKKEAVEAARLEAENDARLAAKQAADAAALKEARHKAEVAELERKAIEAASAAKRELDEKLQAERAAEAKRAADIEHRAKINRAILKVFVDHGIDEATAKSVIKLIATGSVPNASISY